MAGTTTEFKDLRFLLQPNTEYEYRIVGNKSGCPSATSSCIHFTTGAGPCNLTAPVLQGPVNGSSVTSPVTFSWTGNGDSYHLVAAVNGVNHDQSSCEWNTIVATGLAWLLWLVVAFGLWAAFLR